jgi:hypothetical protein
VLVEDSDIRFCLPVVVGGTAGGNGRRAVVRLRSVVDNPASGNGAIGRIAAGAPVIHGKRSVTITRCPTPTEPNRTASSV